MGSAKLAVLPAADRFGFGERGLRGGGIGGFCDERQPFNFSVSSFRRSVLSEDLCEDSLECVGLSAGGLEPERRPNPSRCHRSRVLRRLSIGTDLKWNTKIIYHIFQTINQIVKVESTHLPRI